MNDNRFLEWLQKLASSKVDEVGKGRDFGVDVLFGDRSCIAQTLLQSDLSNCIKELSTKLNEQPYQAPIIKKLLGTQGTLLNGSEVQLIEAGEKAAAQLIGIGKIAQVVIDSFANPTSQAQLILDSVNRFEAVWPTDTRDDSSKHRKIQTFQDEISKVEDQFAQALKGLASNQAQDIFAKRGFGITRDLFYHYNSGRNKNRRFEPNAKDRNIASTPVFLATAKDGCTDGMVMWLTVELFQDEFGTGFAPCPMTMGLTSFTKSSDDDVSFLEAMDKAWRLSCVASRDESLGRFNRGRWMLTHEPMFDCEASVKTEGDRESQKTFYPPSLAGGSAEAAALIAILAASGCIPYSDTEVFRIGKNEPMNLVPSVGITAALNASNVDSTNSSPTKIGLGKVYKCDHKLGAAQDYKNNTETDATLLDTMIVAKLDEQTQDQAVTNRIKNANDNADKARSQQNAFRGITYRELETVGDALDWILSVNRAKHGIQQKRIAVWERQWAQLRIPKTDDQGQKLPEDPDQPPETQIVSSGSLAYLRYIENYPMEVDQPDLVDPDSLKRSVIQEDIPESADE